ncbi:GNAT family N-acetyltransferase [Falsarthrobacter nasiphocae]|uniref:Acetyltransferase n=1 Tax=Falsarthrobacter nasiphocae TaxID=189863 RepID=A0AAE4C4C2_9MICC|nr:GNAT family N-acetyltransferase [Falsarthrobacter nasiphocae]MDR6891216.1 putative acetyltransferase [Falsarthrobacter nasiphocae]
MTETSRDLPYERLAPLTVSRVEAGLSEPGRGPDEATRNWIRAVRQGFHEAEPTTENLAYRAQRLVSKGSVGTVVYDDSLGDDPDFGAAFPVATFESFMGELNLSGREGGSVPCDMITGVTVNPTHRRRGILSTIMTEHLKRVSATCPVASLTVSEGAIYGRFGFAPTSFWEKLEIQTSDARIRGERTGEIRYIPIERVKDFAPKVARQRHESSYGSLWQKDYVIGTFTGEDHEGLKGAMGKRRALVHLNENGEIDGCATYSHGGWEEVDRPYRLEVFELVGATPLAEREMWRHFVAMDLVDVISHDNRSVYTRSFFDNPRSVQVRGRLDFVWWRLLDLPAVFSRLPYLCDGEARFTVTDRQEIVSGTYELTVRDGQGTLTRVEAGSGSGEGCVIDVTTLTEVVAGRVSVRELADVALCSGTDADIADLTRLLRFATPVQCLIGF